MLKIKRKKSVEISDDINTNNQLEVTKYKVTVTKPHLYYLPNVISKN